MSFKFEKLDVWQNSLAYVDLIYELAEELPRKEEFNLKSQITRAATSISLNIAEGSTGQSDAEQARFLGMAIRSLVETVACQQLIRRRKYIPDSTILDNAYREANSLARQLQAFRNSLSKSQRTLRDDSAEYLVDEIEQR
jgi:four helix bundle protein